MPPVKFAIVGFACDGSRVPWDDPTWEIWGLNSGHLRPGLFLRPDGRFRADRWFQIHPPFANDPGEIDWLERLDARAQAGEDGVLTYVRPEDMAHWKRAYPHAARASLLVPFPINLIRAEFPGGWFANTFCLEIALALHWRATEIALHGVECTTYGREVAVERPAVAFWMGACWAYGVQLTIGMDTMSYGPAAPAYGFDYWAEARRAAEITAMVLPPRADLDAENLDTIAAVDTAEDALRAV